MGIADKMVMLCSELDKENYLTNQEKYKGWVKEAKLDGDRAIINNRFILNRSENNWTSKYPQIKLLNKETMIDGEICFLNGNKYRTEFNLGRRKVNWGKCIFVAFDVLKFDGELLINKPLEERSKFLEKIKGKNIRLITEFPNDWDSVEEYELEGLILKNPNSRYIYGTRSKEWIKVKNTKKTNLEFVDFEENNKGLTLISNEGIRVACLGEQSREVRRLIEKNKKVLVTIKYLEKTEGKYRMPTFVEIVKK